MSPAPKNPRHISEMGALRVLKPDEWAKRIRRAVKDADGIAADFRAHLAAAGIARPELFESSKARRPIRFHDTRATFITVALATGKTETWVSDRTGHKSSGQINTYRRAARSAQELGTE